MTVAIITPWSMHDCKCISGIPITFMCQGCIQKVQVQTTHVHNTARSMMDMKRDGYRDQIASMSVNIDYRLWDVGSFHNMHVGTIHCS